MLHSQLTRNKFFLSLFPLLVVLTLILVSLFVLQTSRPLPQLTRSPEILSEDQAVSKVKSLPEVQEFLKNVPTGRVELDHFDKMTNLYLVHVYEIKDNHTATFNWYEVNKTTGQTKKMFDY